MSNLQLNALKSGRKNFAEVTLYLPSNVIGDSNYKANFPHKLLFTDTQISRRCKAFANDSLANMKLSKTQLSRMMHSEEYLCPLSLVVNSKKIILLNSGLNNRFTYSIIRKSDLLKSKKRTLGAFCKCRAIYLWYKVLKGFHQLWV